MSVRGNVVFFFSLPKNKGIKSYFGTPLENFFFEPFFWQRWWFLGIETHFSISDGDACTSRYHSWNFFLKEGILGCVW
jgi:hypothetical protein